MIEKCDFEKKRKFGNVVRKVNIQGKVEIAQAHVYKNCTFKAHVYRLYNITPDNPSLLSTQCVKIII